MRKSILGILALLGTVITLILIAWIWIPVFFEEKYEFTLGYVCFQVIVGELLLVFCRSGNFGIHILIQLLRF